MTELTLIGLGAMGKAIGRALLDNQCKLMVWNRSPNRARGLTSRGATNAASLPQAIEASPTVLICIHGYDATREMLDDPDIIPLLPGRTIVQMSTGTPAEARETEAWIHSHGGYYLDASIMVYPPSIGTEAGQVIISGPREVYAEFEPILKHLGGDIRYLGTPIGAAAALDLAVVSRLVANTVAIVYGIHICESEGVSLPDYASMYPDGDRAHHLAGIIERDNFTEGIASTVATSLSAATSIRKLAQDLGINTEFPEFFEDLYQRASEAGYLEQDSASVIEVFRENP